MNKISSEKLWHRIHVFVKVLIHCVCVVSACVIKKVFQVSLAYFVRSYEEKSRMYIRKSVRRKIFQK